MLVEKGINDFCHITNVVTAHGWVEIDELLCFLLVQELQHIAIVLPFNLALQTCGTGKVIVPS